VAPNSGRRRPRARLLAAGRPAAPDAQIAGLALALRMARTAEDVMSVLVLEAEGAFGAASAVAYALAGANLELVAAMGRAEDAHEWLRVVPLSAQIPVARAIREGRPGWYESRQDLAAAFPGWAERVPHADRFGALAALPLRRAHATLGAVGFAFDQGRTFGPEVRAVLQAVAAEGAVALARVRLLEPIGGEQQAGGPPRRT
jgi:GAF domain-containing protein